MNVVRTTQAGSGKLDSGQLHCRCISSYYLTAAPHDDWRFYLSGYLINSLRLGHLRAFKDLGAFFVRMNVT